jgi:hypothetical protein
MRPMDKPETINATSLLRGLVALPWGAPLPAGVSRRP